MLEPAFAESKIPVTKSNVARDTRIAIRFNTFRRADDKIPTARDLSWAELCAEIKRLAKTQTHRAPRHDKNDRRRLKAQLPAFNTATLSPPYNCDENAQHLSALQLDIDTGGDLPAVYDRLEELGLSALIYTSPSHPDAAGTDRFRVVVPLDEPIASAHAKHARRALAEMLGLRPGQGVERADAISQVFFVGRFKGDPERDVFEIEGKPTRSAVLISAKLTHPWPQPVKKESVKPLERLGIEDPDERAAALIKALEPFWEAPGQAEGRRQVLRALGGYLARRGWSDEQIAAVARALETERPEAARLKLMIECARQTRETDGEKGAGWTGLVQWNPDAAAAVESIAKDPAEPADWPGVWSAAWRALTIGFSNAMAARAERLAAEAANTNAGSDALGVAVDLAGSDEPIDYLCEGLRLAPSEGKISLLAGEPGAGKGPIAAHLAVCFATGRHAFGAFECKQANVLYLDAEGWRLSKRRIRRTASALGVRVEELRGKLHLMQAPDLLHQKFDAIAAYVKAHKIGVVILDSYTSAMLDSGIDANQPEFARLAKDLGRLGVLVLAIAHANKAAANRGGDPRLADVAYSGALSAMAQTAIVLSYPNPKDDKNTIRVACARAPETGFDAFEVVCSNGPGDSLEIERSGLPSGAMRAAAKERDEQRKQAEAVAKRADQVERVLEIRGPAAPLSTRKLKTEAGLNGANWPAARDLCLERGSIAHAHGARESQLWRWVPPEHREPTQDKPRPRTSHDRGQPRTGRD